MRVKAALQSRVAVLLYHRIARPAKDTFQLTVSPEVFAEQLGIASQLAEVVGLEQLVERLAAGAPPRRAVAITFDDGYADNAEKAAPILSGHGLPATFFLATGFVMSGRRFWWDRLADILIGPEELPARFDLAVAGERLRVPLGPERELQSEGPAGRTSQRNELVNGLQRRLRTLPQVEQDALLDHLARWTGVVESEASDGRPMSPHQASVLGAMPGMTLGAHSVAHRSLGDLPPDEQIQEIEDSRNAIEDLTGSPARLFSYPHGVVGEMTMELVAAAGYEAAFTSGGAPVTGSAPLYRLPRIVCEDVGGERFRRMLRAHLFPVGSLRD